MIHSTDALVPPGEHDEHPDEQPTRFIDVHIYDLPPVEEEPPAVESDPPQTRPTDDEEQEITPPDEEQEITPPDDEREPPARRHTRRRTLLALGTLLAFLIAVSLAAALLVRPILLPAPEATITIVTVSTPIRTTSTFMVVTGQTPKVAQIAGRTLVAITMSQQKTITTTGTAHQDAQAAHGLVTFYNAAPFSQVIPAGTILTGADGVQIVTEQHATLPAVSYPTLGQATVPAHALLAGPTGNIVASDIYGPCCRLNISAVNSAFTGGQNARTYQTVAPQDISTGAASMSKTVEQSEQAALQTQVHSDETLITPLPCQQRITPDHQAGTEATQVKVTVSKTCNGTVYTTQPYQDQLMQRLNQQAQKQLGQGYSMTGEIQNTIMHVKHQNQTTILQVTSAATYSYQMNQDQQHVLAELVAGKSTAQATTLLLQAPGVQSVALTTSSKNAIPTDTRAIHITLLQA